MKLDKIKEKKDKNLLHKNLVTVAGVAVLKLDISNMSRIVGVKAMRSLLANVRILLSSMTVFKLSIHLILNVYR